MFAFLSVRRLATLLRHTLAASGGASGLGWDNLMFVRLCAWPAVCVVAVYEVLVDIRLQRSTPTLRIQITVHAGVAVIDDELLVIIGRRSVCTQASFPCRSLHLHLNV